MKSEQAAHISFLSIRDKTLIPCHSYKETVTI